MTPITAIKETEFPSAAAADLAPDGSALLVCDADGVASLYGRKGEKRWSRPMGGEVVSAATSLLGATSLVLTTDGTLILLDRDGGRSWWRRTQQVTSAGMAPDGSCVLIAMGRSVAVLDSAGRLRFQKRLEELGGGRFASFTAGAAASRGGAFVLTTDDGDVFYLTGSGRLRWHFKLAASFNAAAISSAGSAVVASSADGKVVALAREQRGLFQVKCDIRPVAVSVASSVMETAVGMESGRVALMDGKGDVFWEEDLGRGPCHVRLDSSGRTLLAWEAGRGRRGSWLYRLVEGTEAAPLFLEMEPWEKSAEVEAGGLDGQFLEIRGSEGTA